MGDMFYAIATLLIIFALLYWMYGMMVTTVVRWCKKPRKNKKGKMVQPPLTTGEIIKSYIPFYQVSLMRSWLYGSATAFNVMSIIAVICFLLRAINLFVPINSYVMFGTLVLTYIGIILHFIIYGWATAAALKLYGFGWITIIGGFFFPHFVAFFMRTLIPNKMLAMQKEDVFAEHKSDTYIKQRPNK